MPTTGRKRPRQEVHRARNNQERDLLHHEEAQKPRRRLRGAFAELLQDAERARKGGREHSLYDTPHLPRSPILTPPKQRIPRSWNHSTSSLPTLTLF